MEWIIARSGILTTLLLECRPGVIVIVIVMITVFTVIVMVNLILKVIVSVIIDKVIVIHYYFTITFCQTHNTFCQICHYIVKSHCHLIG